MLHCISTPPCCFLLQHILYHHTSFNSLLITAVYKLTWVSIWHKAKILSFVHVLITKQTVLPRCRTTAALQISILTGSYFAFLLCVWVFFSQGAQWVFLPTSILLPLKGQSNREKSPSAFQDSKDSKQLDPARLGLIFLA